MSTPLTACLVYRAAKGDEAAHAEVLSRLQLNLKLGHFSVWPCEHKLPCVPPSAEAMDAYANKLSEALLNNLRGSTTTASNAPPVAQVPLGVLAGIKKARHS